jgi:hypothetical protein
MAIVRFTSFSLLPRIAVSRKLTIITNWKREFTRIPVLKKQKRPAMTKVAECSKLETGVGPSIASGNHKKVVTCTDFRKSAKRRKVVDELNSKE